MDFPEKALLGFVGGVMLVFVIIAYFAVSSEHSLWNECMEQYGNRVTCASMLRGHR
jgi:hypothetical protein